MNLLVYLLKQVQLTDSFSNLAYAICLNQVITHLIYLTQKLFHNLTQFKRVQTRAFFQTCLNQTTESVFQIFSYRTVREIIWSMVVIQNQNAYLLYNVDVFIHIVFKILKIFNLPEKQSEWHCVEYFWRIPFNKVLQKPHNLLS